MHQPDDRYAYEVFAQFGGAGKPITYVGSVRAADPVLAWQAARDAYTRREDCSLLWVVPRSACTRSDPADGMALRPGSSQRYRMPNYPSSRRRARANRADEAVAATSEVSG